MWFMHLKDWAVVQGIHPQTAYRWFREGKLPVPVTRVGSRTILVNVDAPIGGVLGSGGVGLYARVSSTDSNQD